MYNGIINVYKEAGFTSHDVVAKLRGIFGQKKIGHTGTLDPAATGVLPVCLGSGTKLVDMITDKHKTYQAVMLLGVTTDTEDTTGEILSQKTVNVNEEDIGEAVQAFVGPYAQIPPMYSAIKVNGKKLYELAREGTVIERKPRNIEVFSINIDKIELPYVTMTVECGKGTYIRSLCRDIGDKLGCGACMDKLVRTRVDEFAIEQAHSLSELSALKEQGRLDEVVTRVDELFVKYDRIDIKEKYEKLICNGNRLPKDAAKMTERQDALLSECKSFRVYFKDNFFGIFEYCDGWYEPVKIFADAELLWK